MAVVEFKYEDMKRYINLTREKMVASLSDLGAPAEYDKQEDRITVELTPNRPDWYSVEGLGRALRSYHHKEVPQYKTKKSNYVVNVDPSVAKIRPFTASAVVKNLKFDDQRIRDMIMLQEKLHGTLARKGKKFGIGLYPLHAIKFPVSYTTKKPEEIRYIPLGYDKPMSADEVLEKHKKGKEYGHIIKGKERYPLFVDGDGKIMCLIPIVNSAETGKVDEQTKEIFIEVTGTDQNACCAALNILCCTFADMGGDVYEVAVRYDKKKLTTPNLEPVEMKVSLEEMNRRLGFSFKEKQAKEFLLQMGYIYSKGKVAVPPYRADVINWVDVMEDLAIAYGYNNFEPTLPNFFYPGKKINEPKNVGAVLSSMGFVETKSFVLTNMEKLKLIGFTGGVTEIANPNSVDYTVIRPVLSIGMLETLIINKSKGLPQRFYEIGRITHQGADEDRVVLGFVDRKLEFSDARGYLQTLAKEIGIGFGLVKKEIKMFDGEMSYAIVVSGKEIGFFGRLEREVAAKLGLEFEVFICEMKI